MNPEEKSCKKGGCYHLKALFIMLGLCAIAVGVIYLAQFYYKPTYNIARLWPVFPIIVGICVTLTAIFSRKRK